MQEALKALPLTVTGHLQWISYGNCGGVSKRKLTENYGSNWLVDYILRRDNIGCGGRVGYNFSRLFTGMLQGAVRHPQRINNQEIYLVYEATVNLKFYEIRDISN